MTTTEFVASCYLKSVGKTTTLSAGSAKYNKILGIGNFYIDQWSTEKSTSWNSLYNPVYPVGTVTATGTFDLDDEVLKISQQQGDYVRVTHTTAGQYTDYTLVDANRLREHDTGYYAAQIGRTIKFNTAFKTTSPQFGGALTIPAYVKPDPLVNASDVVPVDHPNWLVLISAAEYIRNDITRQSQYPALIAEANEAMEAMRMDNEAQDSTVYQPYTPLGQSWT